MTLTPQQHTAAAVDAISHMQHRVIQDALQEATSAYWRRRAAQFEAARPRTTDQHGRADRATLKTRDQQLAATAQACRNRATVCELTDTETEYLDRLLRTA